MFSIGEFSRISGLPVKTLRLYHDKGLLNPVRVDRDSGYRYYDMRSIDRAGTIVALRNLGFSLVEIKRLVEGCSDDSDLLTDLENRRTELRAQVESMRRSMQEIDQMLAREKEARMVRKSAQFDVEEKLLDSFLIAGVRMRGRYQDIGDGFKRIGKTMGRFICGKAMALYYDSEYKEEDADFEPAMPVRRGREVDGVDVRELPGGRCVSLLHKGPYDALGGSYARLFEYMQEKGYRRVIPSREIYIKGPGLIFKGNPNNYITEIQVLIENSTDA